MARKLKSDRILFLATILLVGLSIVMVYSASAVVALERYHQPYLFLTKQFMWAMLGIGVLGIVEAALVVLILIEPDFGTSMSLVVIAAVMVFAAGINYAYIFGAMLAALLVVAILVMGASYRRRRLLVFLNPWDDPLGDGFQ